MRVFLPVSNRDILATTPEDTSQVYNLYDRDVNGDDYGVTVFYKSKDESDETEIVLADLTIEYVPGTESNSWQQNFNIIFKTLDTNIVADPGNSDDGYICLEFSRWRNGATTKRLDLFLIEMAEKTELMTYGVSDSRWSIVQKFKSIDFYDT